MFDFTAISKFYADLLKFELNLLPSKQLTYGFYIDIFT